MVKRAIALAAILAAAMVTAMAVPAAAQQYPPDTNIITASATCPTPGETLTVQAQTFAAGSTVTIGLASTPTVLGTTTANSDGVATLEVTIPDGAAAGAHTLTASGPSAGGVDLTAALDLQTAISVCSNSNSPEDNSSGTLPRTGGDSSVPLAKIGVGLAAAGGLITALAAAHRRRRTAGAGTA
jgi:protein-tyrosine phosphatase